MILGSTGGKKTTLGFTVYLEDKFSGPASKMKSTLSGLKDEYSMYRANLTSARNTALAIGAGALMISKGMIDAAMEGAEFLHIMQAVLAISEATNDEFRDLKDLAISLGRETIFTPDQVASGMRFMAMAGQTAVQIKETAKDATYLAAATLSPLGGKLGSADILTNALKAFGLEVEHSTLMADMLTHATTSSNVSLLDLGNSIRYVASTAKNLAIPVQDSIAALMALGNAGIQSSMAGTALENMYRYLAMSVSDFATKRQRASWLTLGVSKEDIMTAEGAFIPMVDLLQKIKEGSQGLGAVDLQNAIKEIFGVRGQRAAGTLLRQLDQYRGFVADLHSNKIAGTTKAKSDLMMLTLKGSALKLTSAIQGLKAAWAEIIGNKFLNLFLRGLAKMVGYFTEFIKLPVVGTVAAIALGIVTLTGVIFTLRAALMTIALTADKVKTSFASMTAASQVAMLGLTGQTKNAALGAGFMMGTIGKGKNKGATFYKNSAGKFVSKATAMSSIPGSSMKGVGLLGRWLPKIGKGLMRGLVAMTGPIGIGIMLVATFLPMLIGAITRNTSATKSNTDAVRATMFDPKLQEIYGYIKDQSIDTVFNKIANAMNASIKAGEKTPAEFDGIWKDTSRLVELFTLAMDGDQMRYVSEKPIVVKEGRNNFKP